VKIVASAIVNRQTDRPAAFVVRQDLIDGGAYKTPGDLPGPRLPCRPKPRNSMLSCSCNAAD
jgi:hypothetical protein